VGEGVGDGRSGGWEREMGKGVGGVGDETGRWEEERELRKWEGEKESERQKEK